MSYPGIIRGGSDDRGAAGDDDDLDRQGDQFGRHGWQALEVPLGVAALDQDVPALDVAEVPEPLAERLEGDPRVRIGVQVADAARAGRRPALRWEHPAAGQQAEAGQSQAGTQELVTIPRLLDS